MNKIRQIITLIVLILNITTLMNIDRLTVSAEVLEYEEAFLHFKEENELLNNRFFLDMFKLDEKHLKADFLFVRRDRLNEEVKELERQREELLASIEPIRGAKIIDAKTTKDIWFIEDKIDLRNKLIDNLDNKEVSINKVKHNNHFSTKYYEYKGYDLVSEIPDRIKDINFQTIVSMVKGLRVEDEVFDNIIIYVSPYKIKGINGLSRKVDRPDMNHELIIASSYFSSFSEGVETTDDNVLLSEMTKYKYVKNMEEYDVLLKDTILHEIGHLVDNKIGRYTDTKAYADLVIDKKTKKFIKNHWTNSLAENFAEDFKVYAGKNLLNNQVINFRKDTNFEYLEDFEDILIKNKILKK